MVALNTNGHKGTWAQRRSERKSAEDYILAGLGKLCDSDDGEGEVKIPYALSDGWLNFYMFLSHRVVFMILSLPMRFISYVTFGRIEFYMPQISERVHKLRRSNKVTTTTKSFDGGTISYIKSSEQKSMFSFEGS